MSITLVSPRETELQKQVIELAESLRNLGWEFELYKQDARNIHQKLLDQIRELKAKLGACEKVIGDSIDNNLDKLMAMSDEQVRALSAFEGHNPDDDAKIVKQAAEIAILKHKLSEKQA